MRLGIQIGALIAKAVALAFGAFLVNDLLMMINIRVSPNVPWSLVATIYLTWVVARTIGKRWSGYAIYRPGALKLEVVAYVVASIVACLAALIVQGNLTRLTLVPHAVPEQASSLLRVIVVVFLPQLGAFYEELAFRGTLQGQLHSSFDRRAAILISSVLFCVLHAVNVGFEQQWVAFLLLAVSCGLIAARTATLLPGLLIHAGYNLSISMTTLTWGVIDLSRLPSGIVIGIAAIATGVMAIAVFLLRAVPHSPLPNLAR